jgi:prepilin-type N-terminal cleavage/methylation domain-containing protein
MMHLDKRGLTLLELLLALVIVGLIGGTAVGLLSTGLSAHEQHDARSDLYQEGMMIMERITEGVRRCTFLLIPNAHNPTRDVLAFSGMINKSDKYYFGDPLFPRIDSENSSDMDFDFKNGISGIDDDGDGLVDELGTSSWYDDDEDGIHDEDPMDGLDNDGDGSIDEDTPNDKNNDGAPGIKGVDDDGDDLVDEGSVWDDDEDGELSDSGIVTEVYYIESGTSDFRTTIPYLGETKVLSNHALSFQVTYEAPERILIELTLTDDDGESISFSEYVCPRNRFQKTGKRVR